MLKYLNQTKEESETQIIVSMQYQHTEGQGCDSGHVSMHSTQEPLYFLGQATHTGLLGLLEHMERINGQERRQKGRTPHLLFQSYQPAQLNWYLRENRIRLLQGLNQGERSVNLKQREVVSCVSCHLCPSCQNPQLCLWVQNYMSSMCRTYAIHNYY